VKLKNRVKVIEIRPIEGVKLATQEFKEVDIDRMIKTASELVKRSPEVIVVFYGVDKKTARIVVMAGEEAVNRGIDSSEIAREAASVLGGGGSGRPDFAQGGGTLVKKMSDALAKAEHVIRKQVKRGARD
jgi:alanyl-tRNA synthetase